MVIVSSMTPHGLYGLLLAKLISRHRSIQNTSLYRKKKVNITEHLILNVMVKLSY